MYGTVSSPPVYLELIEQIAAEKYLKQPDRFCPPQAYQRRYDIGLQKTWEGLAIQLRHETVVSLRPKEAETTVTHLRNPVKEALY